MKQSKYVYRVKSDNYDNFMTKNAYKALRLMMSTGDFATHEAKRVHIDKVPYKAEILEHRDIDEAGFVMEVLNSYPEELKKFAIENSFDFKNRNAKGLDSYDNYSGPGGDLRVVVIGQNRDSDVLARANFSAALEMLGGESDTVMVDRYGHWACGWFELILVDPIDRKALETAREIKTALEHDPVLDESNYYELEREEVDEQFDNYQWEFEKNILRALGLNRDEIERDMTKAELTQFTKDIEQLARACFEVSVSWSGIDDAYVNEDDALKLIEGVNSNGRMLNELGELGELALASIGVVGEVDHE